MSIPEPLFLSENIFFPFLCCSLLFGGAKMGSGNVFVDSPFVQMDFNVLISCTDEVPVAEHRATLDYLRASWLSLFPETCVWFRWSGLRYVVVLASPVYFGEGRLVLSCLQRDSGSVMVFSLRWSVNGQFLGCSDRYGSYSDITVESRVLRLRGHYFWAKEWGA